MGDINKNLTNKDIIVKKEICFNVNNEIKKVQKEKNDCLNEFQKLISKDDKNLNDLIYLKIDCIEKTTKRIKELDEIHRYEYNNYIHNFKKEIKPKQYPVTMNKIINKCKRCDFEETLIYF